MTASRPAGFLHSSKEVPTPASGMASSDFFKGDWAETLLECGRGNKGSYELKLEKLQATTNEVSDRESNANKEL